MSNNISITQSKYMSWVLRHGLNKVGLIPDPEGYVKLSDFLKISDKAYNLDVQTVLTIVESCSKQRFAIKKIGTETFIRANQGHSKNVGHLIQTDKLLVKLIEPIQGVFHGTYKKHMESIKTSGLNRMNRQHIHFAKSLNATSGSRNNCNLIVYVNMAEAMATGIEFYESTNGVILTEGINGVLPAKYLSYAEIIKGQPVYL